MSEAERAVIPVAVHNHAKLMQMLGAIWKERQEELETERASALALGAKPDWMWEVFVQNHCTRGGAANLVRQRRERPHAFRWNDTVALSDHERYELFQQLPNPRWRHAVAPALEATFQRIRLAGGPAAVARQFGTLRTAEERIAFLTTFPQIGAKYARNIPMDVYDDLVVDHFAIDHRLNRILSKVNPSARTYAQKEKYLRSVAREIGVPNAWFLDRLLFQFYEQLERGLA